MTRMLVGINQQELRWKPASRYFKHDIPSHLRSWLFDRASLTMRLQHFCADKGFSVRVYSQRRDKITQQEAHSLGLAARKQALVRQVYLRCGECAVVFARTIIPLQALKGRQRRLARLGQRSLGAVLFADKRMQRGELEIVQLPADVAQGAGMQGAVIWGRRSTFTINGQCLLVSEFFLPALFQTEPA